MKFSKVAVVVAGSVMAVGVGAPAFADTTNMTTMPTSINGGVEQAMNEQPLQKAVDGLPLDAALQTVSKATDLLRGETSTNALLGQATGATKGAVPGALGGVVPGASLLGGLPLGG